MSHDDALPHRPIRSYVLRGGRTTGGQARALATLGETYALPFEPCALDFRAVFHRESSTIFEIGFGMGEATAQIAAALPQQTFIACEVHEAGVGALLRRIEERRLTNLRIVRHDAVEVLEQMIAPASLAGVHIYFPDPWPKKRHHKRRLLQAAFAKLLAQRLSQGGYVHCATDWQPYAQQMLAVLSSEPELVNSCDGFAPKPDYRPLTKFEARGLKLGHHVWDVVFLRR